ncbi:MAG: ATP-binding cassette domain-containing protein, partial [Clostridia bacterium]|nr:ATP-binding cassette domain-containing protein [Clostridia bacterium]
MLEIRNVTKIYRSKAGNEVKALDNVSVTFPETGMVFILGKSGSGKSTLLNVIGGLDGCDDGEFIIKGKSSKDFAGSDFDAYRNTFIGFIFQEYNILDDFTVGANIGLALELQGKKATNDKITEILTQVELTEYAKRKPNELSGGQKQRIAIARALVKDPEIIMADEPTGALDSNTGKQIFDTLKQLSKTKLVVIVSHDRDFAERYADRIIEMKDGQIDSDVTKHEVDAKAVSDGILQMNDNLLKIEKGYQLTPKDVELINEYLRTRETDIIVSGDKRLNDSVRNVAGISQDNKSSVFNSTDPEKDVKVKKYDGKQTKFIRSSLPMKNAVKMGSSSLGHKKVRLVFTIFLSLIAFALFGFADTLGAYDKITAATNSIVDTQIKNASFSVGVKYESWSKGELKDTDYEGASMSLNDLSALNQKLGVNFTPVFNGSTNMNAAIPLTENMKSTSKINNQAYEGKLYGFAPMTAEKLTELGFEYVGVLPATDNEIAISKFMYEQFKANGFRNSRENEEVSAENLTMDASSDNSIIGKHLTMRVGMGEYTYKITAIIDTKFEYDRYQSYIPSDSDSQGGNQGGEEGNALIDMVMLKELANTLHYGYHCLGYVTENAITTMSRNMEKWWSESAQLGESMYWSANLKTDSSSDDMFGGGSLYLGRVGNSELIPVIGNDKITWLDGKTSLGDKEMLVSSEILSQAMNKSSVNKYDTLVAAL